MSMAHIAFGSDSQGAGEGEGEGEGELEGVEAVLEGGVGGAALHAPAVESNWHAASALQVLP